MRPDITDNNPIARGRKGGISVIDALVQMLSDGTAGKPRALTFSEIATALSHELGYAVPSSTVRSTVYKYADMFVRELNDAGRIAFRLKNSRRGSAR